MSECSAWIGVIGTVAGAAATLSGHWLNHKLQNKRANSIADKRRDRLNRELQDKRYTWRSIERLGASIGADEVTTTELLIEIGARASLTNAKVWALETRAPYPNETKIEGK
jgi:hypothetical protein